jgi:hypothetical protein
MPTMKGRIATVEDDFWTERKELFTAQFPTYYTKPQEVWARYLSLSRFLSGMMRL